MKLIREEREKKVLGLKELWNIAKKNKANHKGPQDDVQRLKYDLSILMQKIPLHGVKLPATIFVHAEAVLNTKNVAVNNFITYMKRK